MKKLIYSTALLFTACLVQAQLSPAITSWLQNTTVTGKYYIQSNFIEPDFIVDTSDFHATKMNAVRAFKTQFHDPESTEPETYISSPAFLRMLDARATEYGHAIGTRYGEGFTVRRYPGIKNLFDLI